MKKIILITSIIICSTFFAKSQVRIKMKKQNGVYTTPCTVNGLSLSFIFDTGASNVSLSLTESIFMLKNGYLDESDLHGSSFSQIANGDVVENTTVTLGLLEIGGIKLYNIEAVIIHELSAPLLLGQSAIQKLGRIQLEGDELVILDKNTTSTVNSCDEAQTLLEKAEKYYFDKLNYLSASTYQEAYDLCPESFICFDIELMATAYNKINKFRLAIEYLNKAANCAEKKNLFRIYRKLSDSYVSIEEFDNATLNVEKALSIATDDNMKYHCYHDLSSINAKNKNYNQAIIYTEKMIAYYLKDESISQYDVLNGKIHDELLGETYWNLSIHYDKQNLHKKSNYYVAISALCGYELSIEYCNNHSIDYKSLNQSKY